MLDQMFSGHICLAAGRQAWSCEAGGGCPPATPPPPPPLQASTPRVGSGRCSAVACGVIDEQINPKLWYRASTTQQRKKDPCTVAVPPPHRSSGGSTALGRHWGGRHAPLSPCKPYPVKKLGKPVAGCCKHCSHQWGRGPCFPWRMPLACALISLRFIHRSTNHPHDATGCQLPALPLARPLRSPRRLLSEPAAP